MPRTKAQEEQKLSAYFTPESFVIEDIPLQQQGLEFAGKWTSQWKEDKYGALYRLGFSERKDWFSPSIEYLYHIAELLIMKISRQADLELSRESVPVDLEEEELERLKEEVPFAIGMEYVDGEWIRKQWEALLAIFRKEIKGYDGTAARYFAERNSNINVVGRVFFHLVESREEQYPFAFLATYTTKPVKSKRAVHTPLKNALEEFKGDEKKLLSLISTVVKAADKSSFISELLESGELFSPLKLTAKEAYTFLREIAIYEEAGIMCRVPDWWRKRNNSIGLSVTVGEKEPSRIGLNAILDFSPSLRIGDEPITERELREFLNMAEGLVSYKGKWVEISKKKLEAVLQAFDKVKGLAGKNELSLGEAMRLELNGNGLPGIPTDEIDVSISNGQWLKGMKGNLSHPKALGEVTTVPTFRATLRSYQKNGYQWLRQMSQFGFGACLADDMGLGKTVVI